MKKDSCHNLVSVIIPVYKVEKYLERCINTIIHQTYLNLEIILIDDASPDGCPGLCDRFSKQDKRVSVIHKNKNEGLSAARNTGMNIMNGDFIVFVDSDDFMDINAIERWMTLLNKHNGDMVIGKFENYYGIKQDAGKDVGKDAKSSELYTNKEFLKYMLLEDERVCTAWGKLYKRELFHDLRYPENIFFGEDMYLAPVLFHRAAKIIMDYNISYYYSQEGVSLVRSAYNAEKLHRLWAVKEWMKFTDEYYPDLHDMAFYRYATTMINECTPLLYSNDINEKKYLNQITKELMLIYPEIKKNKYVAKKDLLKACILKYQMYGTYRLLRKVFLEGKKR